MSRPRSFDDDALMDAAIELFWVGGYRASSLGDLSRGTGVTNGSLYQAYGSKWALFLEAYRRYCARRVALVAGVFDEPHADVEAALTAYFDAILADCAAHADRRGCLMLNSISELGGHREVVEIATETVAGMEAAVARGIVAAGASDTAPEEVAAIAANAVAVSQSFIQLTRLGRDDGELRSMGRHAAIAAGRVLAS